MARARASFAIFLDVATSNTAGTGDISRLRFYNWRSAEKRVGQYTGQELQHCKGHVQRASYVLRSAQKCPADLSRGPRATTKEHAGDFSRRENYFLVKLRA